MEVQIEKKGIFVGGKTKIYTISPEKIGIITHNHNTDRIRFEMPARVIRHGEVMLQDASVINLLQGTITIKNTTRSIHITDGTITFTERIIPHDDIVFPDISDSATVTVKRTDVVRALTGLCQTVYGVHIECTEDSLRFTTTDRVQLAVTSAPIENPQGVGFSVVVNSTDRLNNFLSTSEDSYVDVSISKSGDAVIFGGKNWEYCIQILNTIFPDCKTKLKEIKAAHHDLIKINNIDHFISVLTCAETKNNYAIFEKREKGLYVVSRGQLGEFSSGQVTELPDECIKFKRIALNIRKLKSGVKKYRDVTGQDSVTLHMGGDTSPVYIDSEIYTYVLMPLLLPS